MKVITETFQFYISSIKTQFEDIDYKVDREFQFYISSIKTSASCEKKWGFNEFQFYISSIKTHKKFRVLPYHCDVSILH